MTQETSLRVLKTGENIFLTGEPGSGKTHALNTYISYLKDHKIEVAVTASTGIAATHINGMTIHSWSGIGIKSTLTTHDLDQIMSKELVVKRILKAQVLVIDEISMLDGHILSLVEEVVRLVKGIPLAFGGMQVVLVGDFFQLPPIVRHGDIAQFAFESPVWQSIDPVVCYISEQHRQDDASLCSLLSGLRQGEIDDSHHKLLELCKTTIFRDGVEPTRLYTHNKNVDQVNKERIDELPTQKKTFSMEGKGSKPLIEGLKKSCLSPELLELKIGATVMCTKNNFEKGFVNGTLGQVVGYDRINQYPIIETIKGKTITIPETSWSVTDGGQVLAEIVQIPLRLAWAITVHKSQGMSLDAAEIDLSSAFEYGQGYVALSRVRSLQGLLLRGCNAQALKVHPKIISHDRYFKTQSETSEKMFDDMDRRELKKMHKVFITAAGGLLTVDSSWAKEEHKKKKSTQEITKDLLLKGKTLQKIAIKRNLKQHTIIKHVYNLLTEKLITLKDVEHLKPQDDVWKKKYAEIRKAFEEHGHIELRPIMDATNWKYSYDDLFLARLFVIV